MSGVDIGYLDLSSPIDDEVVCLSNWPSTSFSLEPEVWRWWESVLDGVTNDEWLPTTYVFAFYIFTPQTSVALGLLATLLEE